MRSTFYSSAGVQGLAHAELHREARLLQSHNLITFGRDLHRRNAEGLRQYATVSGRARTCGLVSARRRDVDDRDDWDDEPRPGPSGSKFPSSTSAIVNQLWSAAGGIVDRISDVVYDFVPDSISRSVVDTSVRAALILLLLGFARSILGILLTVGTVTLGLYVASRLTGISTPDYDGKKRSSKSGSGGSSERETRRRLPSGLADDSGVMDVWFEEKRKKEDRPPR